MKKLNIDGKIYNDVSRIELQDGIAPITGLPNKTAIFYNMVKQAQRYYDESALYAILFDLDNSIDSDLDEIEALLDAAGVYPKILCTIHAQLTLSNKINPYLA